MATQPKASTFAEICDWVKSHFQLEMVGGQGIYDLSKPIA